ncbi:MAG: hypothetical protein JNL36_00725 [Candidatus Kapabacteria bacterium]|nr:hypothetical protein [Candidatus Kapabacteria bacterium]
MKTLILLLLLVSTTNVFSQGKYINKKEYDQLMKRFEGETKANRDLVINAFWEWINTQNYFTSEGLLEGDPDVYDIDGKLNASLFYLGVLPKYNVSIIEKFDESKQRTRYNQDTVIITDYLGKATERKEVTTDLNGEKIKGVKFVEVEKICRKRFDITFETFVNKKKRTYFKIIVSCNYDAFEIGKTTPEMQEYSKTYLPTAYSFDIIKEIQDYIYKKVGK